MANDMAPTNTQGLLHIINPKTDIHISLTEIVAWIGDCIHGFLLHVIRNPYFNLMSGSFASSSNNIRPQWIWAWPAFIHHNKPYLA